MKYLKISIFVFLGSIALAVSGINAMVLAVDGLVLPIMQGYAVYGDAAKDNNGYHRVKKIDCFDDLSGDGRVVVGRIQSLTSSGGVSSEHELPKNEWYQFEEFQNSGSFNLQVRSKKFLITTASFYGTWQLDHRPAGY